MVGVSREGRMREGERESRASADPRLTGDVSGRKPLDVAGRGR